jgi:hypothetical protein
VLLRALNIKKNSATLCPRGLVVKPCLWALVVK